MRNPLDILLNKYNLDADKKNSYEQNGYIRNRNM